MSVATQNRIAKITDDTFEAEVCSQKSPCSWTSGQIGVRRCRAMTPALESVAEKFEGRARIAKVNVDENIDVPQRFGVRAIPTLVLFKGGKPVQALVGARPMAQLTEALGLHVLDQTIRCFGPIDSSRPLRSSETTLQRTTSQSRRRR